MFSKVLADDFDPEGLYNPPQAESYLLSFKRGNSLTASLTQYHPANTLTHKPLLHFEEKVKRAKANKGNENELREEKEDGRVQIKSSGGGWAQFNQAALY